MTIYQAIVDTPLTKLDIICNEQQLIRIEFADPSAKVSKTIPSLIKETLLQIEAYISDPSYQFNLPLSKAATEFQGKVRLALQKIPLGTTHTYQQLAQQINTSPRAIGNACRANPFPIIIPCHRIVAVNGLGGFAGKLEGYLIDLKAQLLALETRRTHHAHV